MYTASLNLRESEREREIESVREREEGELGSS